MKYLETKHEKRAFTIATTIVALLLLLAIFFGLSYMDPPPENGIAINFGNVDEGMGNDNSPELTKSSPTPTETTPPPPSAEEQVLTQDDLEAEVIKATKEKAKPQKPKETTVKKPVESKVEAKKPSQQTTDALSNLLNGPKQDGTTSASDGNGKKPGNQGALDGSIYANSYYGSGSGAGAGSGKGWGLAGRNLAGSGKVLQECNDEGTIVVQITVNRQGVVTETNFSAKGSTSTSTCLKKAAFETAKKYRWNPDGNAPEKQVGFIVVNFRTGE
jgi:outer membrane biosynthesis protein TonB